MEKIVSRVKENFKKNKVILAVVMVLWTVVVAVSLVFYSSTMGKESIGNDLTGYVVELTKDSNIEEVLPVEENADSIAIKLATYARNNKGNVFIEVKGADDGYIYADETVNVKNVNDNAFYTVKLDKKLNGSDNKKIIVNITSDSETGRGIGLYYSAESFFEDSSLVVDSVSQEGDLTMKFVKENSELHDFYVKVVSWSVFGITLIMLMVLLLDPSYEVLFTVMIFILGLIFMVVMVPLSPPDEQYHYEASLQVSNYMMFKENHLEINKAYLNYSYLYGHYNVSGGYIRFINDINMPLDLSSKTAVITSDIADSVKICYIPQAFAITVCRLLGVNMLKTFYAGRLASLIMYCTCAFVAIKNTPIHKFLFGVILSMPMFVQTASSYTYDTFIICASVLLLAFFLKWRYSETEIKIWEYVLVLLCCLGLARLKFIYGFLSLIFIFVPYKKFVNKKRKWIAVILLMAASMYMVVPLIFQRVNKYFDNFLESFMKEETSEEVVIEDTPVQEEIVVEENNPVNEDLQENAVEENSAEPKETDISEEENANMPEVVVNDETSVPEEDAPSNDGSNISAVGDLADEQEYKEFESIYSTKYVFEHPFETMQIFLRTVRYNIKTWFYASLGRSLSGSTLTLPLSIVHLLAVVVLLASFRKEPYTPNILMRFLSVGICIIVGVVMMAGFFVTWTEASQTVLDDFGGIMVQGIQGRYFCPLLPYFFTVFNNKKFSIPEKFDKYILFVYLVIFFEIVLYVMSYTFLN